jgi:FKBP-type peptidyl-prolyl cis-trans isomerase FklB
MKLKSILFILIITSFTFAAHAQKKKKPVKLVTNQDSVSYSIGSLIGGNLHSGGFTNINVEVFARAIQDALNPTDTLIKPEAANEIVQKYYMAMQKQKSDKNLAEGKAFLENNKKQAGVVELPSGLQYKIVQEGNGASPTAQDKVTAHYKGSLINGKVFDSSYERGEPAQFGVSDVIEGWKEALQLMKPGSKWTLFIPANLAYGEHQMQGSPIEPNSALIFEVELISVDKEPAQPTEEGNLDDIKIEDANGNTIEKNNN